MKVYFTDEFVLPLPVGHRFPMQKYSLLRERVAAARLPGLEMMVPPPATDEQLALVHHPDYIAKVVNGTLSEKEIRRIGFPWSPGMVERSRRSVGGTIAACRSALSEGLAANLAGGTHHAYPDHGEGYCVFNDVAVAARVMQMEGRLQNVVLIDLDVHQGNGSAAILPGMTASSPSPSMAARIFRSTKSSAIWTSPSRTSPATSNTWRLSGVGQMKPSCGLMRTWPSIWQARILSGETLWAG
jgi:acetoin utilization deacetylase AcuC-like enzyme